jgi:NAD(P)-dependent dehydrogenase (short-subunit alcohol dehydrogenase family)
MLQRGLEAIQKTDPEMIKQWVEPVGRFGTAQEQAEAAVWLCSDAASFVTGHVFPVDVCHHPGNRATD